MPFTYSLCMLPGLSTLPYGVGYEPYTVLYRHNTARHAIPFPHPVRVVRTMSCRDRSCFNAHAIARASRTTRTVSVTVHADTYRLTPTPVASLLEAAAHAGRENRGEGARL
jgi:hypothetical protein